MGSMNPKPVSLTQVDAEDYDSALEPQPLLVVGPVPGTTGDPGTVVIDDSEFQVLQGENPQDAFASTDEALLAARATGIISGGALTDLGGGVVRIAAGAGQILDTTNPMNPSFVTVSWPQQDINISALPDGQQNWIVADEMGALSVTSTEPGHVDYRLSIPLHRVVVRAGVLTGTVAVVQPVQQLAAQVWDLLHALGLRKHRHGNDFAITNAGGAARINISAGSMYTPGANFYNNSNSPHEVEFPSQIPATFRLVLRDNTQSADTTSLSVTQYDNNGVLTTMTANHWGIYEIYMFPNGNVRILCPQVTYNQLSTARAALYDGLYQPQVPTNLNDALRLGWVVFQRDDTALANAVFITANETGGIGGAVQSVGAGLLAAANNLNDVANKVTSATNLLVALPGYSASATQQLRHVSGVMQWVTV